MASHRILSLCDDALVAYLFSLGIGNPPNTVIDQPDGDTWSAKRSREKVMPCTVVNSHSWSPAPGEEYTGNAMVEVDILVKTLAPADVTANPDSPQSDSDSRVAATFDAFELGPAGDASAVVNGINAAAHALDANGKPAVTFTVFGCVLAGGSFAQDGDAWLDTLKLTLYCCPSVIA